MVVRTLLAVIECHLSYRLFRVGFILEENLLTTRALTLALSHGERESFVTLCDTSW